jgi:hypothetical protein
LNNDLQKFAGIIAFKNKEHSMIHNDEYYADFLNPLSYIYNSKGEQQEDSTIKSTPYNIDGYWSITIPRNKRPVNNVYLTIESDSYPPSEKTGIQVVINDKSTNNIDLGKIYLSGVKLSGTIGNVTVDGYPAKDVYIKTIYYSPISNYKIGYTAGMNTIVKDYVRLNSNWKLNIGECPPNGGLTITVHAYSPSAYLSEEKTGRAGFTKKYEVKDLPASIDFGDLKLTQTQ